MEYAPFGDLAKLVMSDKLPRDFTLVRTIFHQLIEGLSFLHRSGVAHLDLKLENILIGDGYNMKIADFDTSFFKDDKHHRSRGTQGYRAPEIILGECADKKAADIYSMGIILFALATKNMPYIEGVQIEGVDFQELVWKQDEEFWSLHADCSGTEPVVDKDFKQLIWSMLKMNPAERMTIENVKASKWYQGEIYTNDKCQKLMIKVVKA